MSFHQFYPPAEESSAGSNDEPFPGRWLSQTPILQHPNLDPSASPHYDSDQERPLWPRTPTSPAAPILLSPRQCNVITLPGELPRQPFQPTSTVVSPFWESSQTDNFHTDTLQETFPNRVPSLRDTSRTGRGAKFLCGPCRERRKGFKCDKDDKDPHSLCSPCRERGSACGQRTLPEIRMENICTKIKQNNLKELLKWMTGLEEKDRELLRAQLPPSEANRLCVAWNKEVCMDSNSTKDPRSAYERPVDMRGPLDGTGFGAGAANLRQTSSVTAHEYPALRSTPLGPRPVLFHSPESYTASIYCHSAQQNHQFTPSHERRSFTEFSALSPTSATNSQVLLPREETYRQTWTENELDAIWIRKLSQRYPYLGPDRLNSLVDDFYENMRTENFITQLSGYTSGENPASGYNYPDNDAGI